jgi:hypothetical protein
MPCPLCDDTSRYDDEDGEGPRPCVCPRGRRAELTGALRRCPWLGHPGIQARHFAQRDPARHWRFHRWRERRPRRRPSDRQVLARLLAGPIW